MTTEFSAAVVTGGVVMALTNPLDTAKQRFQSTRLSASSTASSSLALSMRAILREEGLWAGLWRPGLVSNCCACAISVGCRLGSYPSLRDVLSGGEGKSAWASTAAGLLGGAWGYFCCAPFTQATRITQAEAGVVDSASSAVLVTGLRAGSPPRAGPFGMGTLLQLAQESGVFSLWRGASTLVLRGAVLSSSQLVTYDFTKDLLLRRRGAGTEAVGFSEDGPVVHAAASFAASLACATAICPFDVVLTRHLCGPALGFQRFGGPLGCARHMMRTEGPRVFLRGWVPLWARFLPSSVLTFFIYEQIRFWALGSYLN